MKTLEHFYQFVQEINESNSRLYKQSVLKKYADDEVVRKYLIIAFDPYLIFGISTKKLHKEITGVTGELEDLVVFDLFDYLKEHNTGTTAEIVECQLAVAFAKSNGSELAELLETLICKDLSIGCDAKTINKEMTDLIPTFNVQLASKYFDKPQFVEGKQFAITTKIDGGRIIALKENGQVSFFTRAGQPYEGLVDLEDEMLRLIPDNTCLDGEIVVIKGAPSQETYKATMKIVRTKDKEKHGVKMLVFDCMTAEEFKKQQCYLSYSARRAINERFFAQHEFKYFELLPILYQGDDTSKITEILDEQMAKGEEGIMINILDAQYEFKRTNNLLKVKKMQTFDLSVVGVEEGEGRLAGTLGAVLVQYKNGNLVKVGSGFTDDMRTMIWANRDQYIGRIAEVQYFEETTNADGGESLRFPIFKDFRSDKTEADF